MASRGRWRASVVVSASAVGIVAVTSVGVALLTSAAGAAQPGGNCGDPLPWAVPGRVARDLTSQPGNHASRRLPDGSKLAIDSDENADGERFIVASTSSRGWRICGVSRPDGGRHIRVLAPVSDFHGKSAVGRAFAKPSSSLVVWYARRSRTLDGASCANPYVVVGTDLFRLPTQGDVRAGQIRRDVKVGRNGTSRVTVSWRPNPGYRTCLAAGFGGYASHPWIDRRQGNNRSHLMETYTYGGSHPKTDRYFFAAFRRA